MQRRAAAARPKQRRQPYQLDTIPLTDRAPARAIVATSRAAVSTARPYDRGPSSARQVA